MKIERGQTGDRGVAGERGQKGDHGQHGKPGERGLAGKDGSNGQYLNRHQVLAMFGFVVLAFVLLAYRSEVGQRHTDANARHIAANGERIGVNGMRIAANAKIIIATQNKACLTSLEIIKKFNAEQIRLAQIEALNLHTPASIRQARIMAYLSVRIIPLPICETIQIALVP